MGAIPNKAVLRRAYIAVYVRNGLIPGTIKARALRACAARPPEPELARRADLPWWADENLWTDEPPVRSVFEAAAIASIAAQARALHYEPSAKHDVIGAMFDYADQWMHEVLVDPTALHDLPLRGRFWRSVPASAVVVRSIYDPRDVEVINVEGIHVEILNTVADFLDQTVRMSHRRWGAHRDATAQAV